ncbi:hypothetical protein DSCA_47220 [Desulfosarcina alkanivorans]|uniref:Uncharacterized protein n=1 Tax=Desulfosarcina alkanivorans TaxID=571177 RepID=A0A5K7YM13_9BACT|nr:hypothetical protein DSCA_47220 [Desulfosarcina alkanivorans]
MIDIIGNPGDQGAVQAVDPPAGIFGHKNMMPPYGYSIIQLLISHVGAAASIFDLLQ